MNVTEQRRIDLLTQTRNLYKDKGSIPAIHPRYGNAYQKLYERPKEGTGRSSLGFRMFLSFLLFVGFASLDYSGIYVSNYGSEEIIEVISQDIQAENVEIENIDIENSLETW